MVGIFLAVLELTRHHNVVAHQNDLHSEILIVANDGFSERLDVSNIDDYNPHNQNLPTGDPGSMVDP
jgi:segregation and condensation protein A